MVISHLLQSIFQTNTAVTGRTPQLLHLREQGPIFCHDAGKFDPWKFDPVINSDAPGL